MPFPADTGGWNSQRPLPKNSNDKDPGNFSMSFSGFTMETTIIDLGAHFILLASLLFRKEREFLWCEMLQRGTFTRHADGFRQSIEKTQWRAVTTSCGIFRRPRLSA
jgi:hypothetical protein